MLEVNYMKSLRTLLITRNKILSMKINKRELLLFMQYFSASNMNAI